MGTCGVLTRELSAAKSKGLIDRSPLRVLELGAGDGSMMLRVARALKPRWPKVQLTLLDRLDLLDAKTRAGYSAIGWTAVPKIMDALEWVRRDDGSAGLNQNENGRPWDLIVANLFLHHFEAADLRVLLNAIARRCNVFVACEPRRSMFALAGSHLIGAIGAGAVTRTDAVLSVRAGFSGSELSALWPADSAAWSVAEHAAAGFSHCFRAERVASKASTAG